jgi:hypothetical protein
MGDEWATEVAVPHAERPSAESAWSNGAVRHLPLSGRRGSASNADLTSSEPSDEVPGRHEAKTSMPRVGPIVRSLQVRLGEGLDFAVIAAEVEAELSTYANARVTQFIPILVESRVWDRLRDMSRSDTAAEGHGGSAPLGAAIELHLGGS